MYRNKRLFAALATAAILAIPAAASAIMSVPSGWYLEVNGGSAHLTNTNFPNGSSSNKSGLGGNANVGYKFMPYFGTEIGYTLYPNVNIKAPNGGNAATNKMYGYDLAFRGILPFSDTGIEAFAKLGIQHLTAHTSINSATAANQIGISSGTHTNTGLYLGAGAQYYFIPECAVNLQWQRAQGSSSTGTEDLFSVGFSFIFD